MKDQTSSSSYIDNYYTRTLGPVETKYPSLSGSHEADACVIGGGLAGLNTALGLLLRGKSVILIEAKRIGWGASGRNGGFVAKGYAADDEDLFKRLGLDHARKLVDLTKHGRTLIRSRIDEYKIDCGPLNYGVMMTSMRDRAARTEESVRIANDRFNLDLEYWPTEKLRTLCKTDSYYQGMFSPHDFQFHPLRYVQGLAKTVTDKGGTVYEESPAQDVVRDGAGWVVKTATGQVRAKDVVLCCAVYSHGLDRRLEGATFPVQTYVTVTKPLDEDVLRNSVNSPYPIYEMRFASNYYRVLPDRRILWGGRVGLWAEPHDIAQQQMADMIKIYPQLKGVAAAEQAWSGLMAYAPHKMPQIGKIAPGYWYNTGFGGHGLVPTTVGGEVIAGAIAANDTTIDLFKPFGIHYAGGKAGRYVAQMVYWLWRARDYVDI